MESIDKHLIHDTADIDKLRRELDSAVQITSGGFVLCIAGSCDIVVNIKQYHLEQWDMAVVLPYSVIQVLQSSDDFEFVMASANINFLMELNIPNKGSYFTNIREYPSISLSKSEAENIISLHNNLLREQQMVDHPFRSEIEDALLRIICYEVAAIYQSRKPIIKEKNNRSETIFYSFIFQLLNNFHKKRAIEYYAQQQQITASHLSKCVKQISGRSASEWISSCVANNMQIALQNRNRSIAEIADEFNFPNSSFFSQYYKRYMGTTPRDYRATLTPKREAARRQPPTATQG